MMKIGIAIAMALCLASPLLAGDIPKIPKELKGYHYASDTNVTADVSKAIEAAVAALRKNGHKHLDGTDGQGVIYHVQKKAPGYWVMCQNYSGGKDDFLNLIVGDYVWVILDEKFRFKEFGLGS